MRRCSCCATSARIAPQSNLLLVDQGNRYAAMAETLQLYRHSEISSRGLVQPKPLQLLLRAVGLEQTLHSVDASTA